MNLKKCLVQDWSGSFAYAPPLKDAVINLDEVSTIQETDSRGCGPWVRVTMRNGDRFIVQGVPADFATK